VPLTAIAIQVGHHLQQEGAFLEEEPETTP
jgi:hypothetical protein